jgi:hypothetical protein
LIHLHVNAASKKGLALEAAHDLRGPRKDRQLMGRGALWAG